MFLQVESRCIMQAANLGFFFTGPDGNLPE